MALREVGEAPARPPADIAAALVAALPVGVGCIDAEQRVVLANPQLAAVLAVTAGVELRDAPEPLGRLGACARDVIASRRADTLELPGGAGVARVIPLDDRHAGVLLAPRETPERAEAALGRLAVLVARDGPEAGVFATAAEEGARLLGAETGAVLRYLGGRRAVVVGVWREEGVRALPVNAELDLHGADSALGRVYTTRRPARAGDYDRGKGELPVMMRASGLRSSVAAPIVLDGDVWGAVAASTTRDEPLPAGAELRLAPVAELVGQALADRAERRRMDEARLRLVEAADESRRRLEERLHAGATQHLAALLLSLRLARTRTPDEADLARLLDASLAEAGAIDSSLRELARGLHPAVLTERGLPAALQALTARSGVPVRLQALPAGRFPEAIERTVYHVVGAALANVARHAHATEAGVRVEERGDRLVVEVADNGIGGADPAAGWGLRALADRVAAVGGRLDVRSPRGEGTVVRAELRTGR